MSRSQSVVRAALAAALLVATGPAAAQGRDEQSAEDAAYACPEPADPAVLLEQAAALRLASYDKNKLGCSADLMFAAAQRSPGDIAVNLQALLVITEYLDHVNTLWDFDLYGVRVPEWTARLEHATARGRQLAAHLGRLAPGEPSVLAARALFDLARIFKGTEPAVQLATSRQTIGMLEEATGRDPGVLEGHGLLALGRLYFELPEYSGGDVEKALSALQRARELAPTNASAVRYLAYALEQERRRDEARTLLAGLLALEPQASELQLMADELRNARDLAARMQATELEQQLDDKRSALLRAHPELLTRASTAANMHGGVDPLTGEPY